jgi:hypothetical protein
MNRHGSEEYIHPGPLYLAGIQDGVPSTWVIEKPFLSKK